jgi:hypothetical protein
MQKPDDQDRLTSALRALAEDDGATGASPAVEARLLAHVRASSHARRRRTAVAWFAMAAALLVTIGLSVWRLLPRGDQQSVSTPAVTLASREVATEFFPLRYSRVPAAATHIVRLEVPRSALASFGLASFDDVSVSPSGTVIADVVIGEDGLARAVRFVRPAVQ